MILNATILPPRSDVDDFKFADARKLSSRRDNGGCHDRLSMDRRRQGNSKKNRVLTYSTVILPSIVSRSFELALKSAQALVFHTPVLQFLCCRLSKGRELASN